MRFRVDIPLSKTRYHDLIRDMKAVVDRPLEQRQLEAALAGWVRRPMNGFMLYRRAYTLVVEKEYGATKQQEISQVCGASWKLEPAAVREKYESLGMREMNGHQQAHPGYRFRPGRANRPSKKSPGCSDAECGVTDIAMGTSPMIRMNDSSFQTGNSNVLDSPASLSTPSCGSSASQTDRVSGSDVMTRSSSSEDSFLDLSATGPRYMNEGSPSLWLPNDDKQDSVTNVDTSPELKSFPCPLKEDPPLSCCFPGVTPPLIPSGAWLPEPPEVSLPSDVYLQADLWYSESPFYQ